MLVDMNNRRWRKRYGPHGFDAMARYADLSVTLAEVMEPGFFPASVGLNLHTELTVFASDGAIKTYVSGHLPSGEPILSTYLDAIPSADSAASDRRSGRAARAAA